MERQEHFVAKPEQALVTLLEETLKKMPMETMPLELEEQMGILMREAHMNQTLERLKMLLENDDF